MTSIVGTAAPSGEFDQRLTAHGEPIANFAHVSQVQRKALRVIAAVGKLRRFGSPPCWAADGSEPIRNATIASLCDREALRLICRGPRSYWVELSEKGRWYVRSLDAIDRDFLDNVRALGVNA